MIYAAACFVLPLMHHLVEQCVDGLVPPMTADVAAADYDLGRSALLSSPRVVTEAAFQTAGDPNRHLAELSPELFAIQPRMPRNELGHVRLVGRMSFFRRASRARLRPRVRRNSVREKSPSRLSALAPCPGLNEVDDRLEHMIRRIEESAVNTNLGGGVADDYRSVLRESDDVARVESEADEHPPQIVSI